MTDPFDAPYPLVPPAPEPVFKLPEPPEAVRAWRWVPRGESCTICGVEIPGGLLYVGRGLMGSDNQPDPALIDGSLPVGSSLYDVGHMDRGYWPSYTRLSRNNRKAYLQWLSRGRAEPDANIGYVFLYFYGLERRVLLDFAQMPFEAVREEALAIADEVERLLRVYGGNPSFYRYAANFLVYAKASAISPSRYLEPPPLWWGSAPRLEVAAALTQFSQADLPIDADWALALLRACGFGGRQLDLHNRGRVVELIFRTLFLESYPLGLRIRVTPQQAGGYVPASGGFRGIRFLLKCSTDVLDGMSRELFLLSGLLVEADAHAKKLLGPGRASNKELVLFALRGPDTPTHQEALDRLRSRLALEGGLLAVRPDELWEPFCEAGPVSIPLREALVVRMRDEGIVIRFAPDPRRSQHYSVVLRPAGGAECAEGPEVAALTRLLNMCLYFLSRPPKGGLPAYAANVLERLIEGWHGLTADQRLEARVQLIWLGEGLLPLSKKLVETERLEVRKAAAAVLCVALGGGSPTLAQMKWLEKAYGMLGFEQGQVYADLCNVALPVRLATEAALALGGSHALELDVARVEALRAETAQVASMLSAVFVDEQSGLVPTDVPAAADDHPCALPLPAEQAAFLRWMLDQTPLTNEGLEAEAARRGVMLAGVLESINEAAFDRYGEPLIESDDPIELNVELSKEIFA